MLIEKFSAQVKKTPGNIAIQTENRAFTYKELDEYAGKIAGQIKSHCTKCSQTTKPGEPKKPGNVALILEHGVTMVAAILGTLKAGKSYVPVSPGYPPNRVDYILKNSQARLTLTQSGQGEIIVTKITQEDNNEIEDERGEDDKRAYIMYTSGSTGRPKGVVQNHENIDYYIRNWTQRFAITEKDRLTLFSSFCHDGSVQDMFAALLNGATLYPFDVRKRDDNLNLAQFLQHQKITIWHSVPSLFNFFVSTLTGGEQFPDLRWVLLGGEPFRGYEIAMFNKYFPGAMLANVYGQTESSVTSIWEIRPGQHIENLVLGKPLNRTRVFIVDEEGNEVDKLRSGEILVACPHISPGYWQDKELTEQSFSRDPEWGPIYWTGDLGRLLADGNIEFMGRKDFQVKIRGFRVETGEIETTLLKFPGVKEAVVIAKERETGNTYLCAFITADKELNAAELRKFTAGELPDYMVPAQFVQLEKMPLTQSGKIDRKTLAQMEKEPLKSAAVYTAPATHMEHIIKGVWQEVLGLDNVGVHDNVFEVGANSFDIIKINGKLNELLQMKIPVVKLFEYPTIADLARWLGTPANTSNNSTATAEKDKKGTGKKRQKRRSRGISGPTAIIGMAGRFPGAVNINEFWENLKNGSESISFFSDEELIAAGIPVETIKNPDYIRAKGVLEDIEYFDAPFFNFTAGEAEVMDPQLRVFLECAWEAFANAGYYPANYDGLIGVYAGNSPNITWLSRVYLRSDGDGTSALGALEKGFLNNHLSTYVSYKLALTGPSLSLRTACSTSLAAVHTACGGLALSECDMALAGGISVSLPKKSGYLYRPGLIFSADGHIRTFDARSTGTVFGDGVGCVVLKRLEDALADNDHIYAVIKSSALNNDGDKKAGYTAPGISGQREVIQYALATAGIPPESIGCIETHGTGTILGDAVEIEALRPLFPQNGKKYCALGSVKTNVGHLNAAAGIAGFIKTVLCLYYGLIPPSLHFEVPNPELDLENSPFYVNTKLQRWQQNGYPFRAGVSSFGFGGTNVHVILEEAPEKPAHTAGREEKLILLSAQTAPALERMTKNLAEYLKNNSHIELADAAFTLQVGRKVFPCRRMLTASHTDEVIAGLISLDPERLFSAEYHGENPALIFMFPGQGAQYVNMARELYDREIVFREEMDRCFEILAPLTGCDMKEILYPAKGTTNNANKADVRAEKIQQTEMTQPVIFICEYALAKLLMKWGISPRAMIGHSIGEYTAACLAGVFSLADALRLVTLRGRLIQQLPAGGMISVPLPAEEIIPLLPRSLSLAAQNTTGHCVVSGPNDALDLLANELKAKGRETRRLHTSHAFHSKMMEPILAEFAVKAGKITFQPPQIPIISNVTGQWLTGEEAVDPGYWARHIRSTVQFETGLDLLLKEQDAIFLEVGPGRTLSTFTAQHKDRLPQHTTINLLRHPQENIPDSLHLLKQLGHLWLHGAPIDWAAFHELEKRQRVPLPGYSFEKKYYWIGSEPLKGSPEKLPATTLIRHRPTLYPRPGLSSPYKGPETDLELQLAAVWQTFFALDQVGIYDNFFELGGDSLKAVQLIAKIHKALDVTVPVPAFFSHANIKNLAIYIGGQKKDRYTAIEPVEKKEYYLLSSAQERIFLLQQLDPASTAYHITTLLRIAGLIDEEKFKDTWKKLIRHHESLRTSFTLIGDCPVQKIHADAHFEIETLTSVEQSWKSFIRSFNLAEAPLLRVGLFKEAESKYLMIIDLHHLVADGISLRVLAQDFAAIYAGASLPSLRLQYKDYAQWQNEAKAKEIFQAQAQYWQEQFPVNRETPVFELPTDFPRPTVKSFAGDRMHFEITPGEFDRLKARAQAEGVTLYTLLLAVFNVFLYKVTKQETIVVGTVIAGRRHADLEPLIGVFINTLGLINYFEKDMTFKNFLTNVNKGFLTALENQDYPFEELVKRTISRRDTGRNPLFDVMFAYENFTANKIEIPGLQLSSPGYENKTAQFDLTLAVYEKQENLHFTFEYCTALFKEVTIREFVNYFKSILFSILADSECLPTEIVVQHGYFESDTNEFADGLGDF